MFIVAGGLNTGISAFSMAIPFMIAAIFISKNKLKSVYWMWGTAMLILVSLVLSMTLEKNPIIFPILKEGHIQITRDSYYLRFGDGSGLLSSSDPSRYKFTPDNPTVSRVTEGSIYQVTGVSIDLAGFSNSINLETELGVIFQSSYEAVGDDKPLAITNKTVHASWAKKFTQLMGWPIIVYLPFIIF